MESTTTADNDAHVWRSSMIVVLLLPTDTFVTFNRTLLATSAIELNFYSSSLKLKLNFLQAANYSTRGIVCEKSKNSFAIHIARSLVVA
jgi:hypothetical protein